MPNWERTSLNTIQAHKWIKKSYSYSCAEIYGYSQYLNEKYIQNSYELLIQSLPENVRKINDINTTFKYKQRDYYKTTRELKKLKNVHPQNKIEFSSYNSPISIIETLKSTGIKVPLRLLSMGSNKLQIWDRRSRIEKLKIKIANRRNLINSSVTIFEFDQNNKRKFLLKGRNNKKIPIKLKIASFNCGGLGNKEAVYSLEGVLIRYDIDICLIQESKLKSSPILKNYFPIFKSAYGQNKTKGGLVILYAKFLRKFVQEILINHRDALAITIGDLTLINIYGRTFSTIEKEQFIQFLQKTITEYQFTQTIFGGDFNMTSETITEKVDFKNFKIITGNQPSRKKRNIDYFITNTLDSLNNQSIVFDIKQKKFQKAQSKAFSDHRMVVNEMVIPKQLDVETVYNIKDETNYFYEFTEWISNSNYEMNNNTFSKLKKKFESKRQTIYQTDPEKQEIYRMLKNILHDPSLIKKIKRSDQKGYNNLMEQINQEFNTHGNFWKQLNKVRRKTKKMFKNNPVLEKEFKKVVETNIYPISNKIKQFIHDTKVKNKHNNVKIFTKQNIYTTIKLSKNKSVKEFDKIKIYQEIIKINPQAIIIIPMIKKIFKKWINNPNLETLKFIKERDLLFINKSGREGDPKDYRPISINSTLPRIFLKIINQQLESTWEKITNKQYGFRKGLDTRIAVMNFLKVYKNARKTNKNMFMVTIDIAKCFDTVSHQILQLVINKFIENNKIRNFLKQYYDEQGYGVYQGDPLSPILFAFISHFMILMIQPLVTHVQMYADDLILIMKGPLNKVKKNLIPIYEIIHGFGMNPNGSKTKHTQNYSEIKYLGIWLDKSTHIMNNKNKAQKTFDTHSHLLTRNKVSVGLRVQLFKTIILSQLYYGIEIFKFTVEEINRLNSWINIKIKKIIKLQIGTPTLILRAEIKIDFIDIIINRRKRKLFDKLFQQKIDHLTEEIQFQKDRTQIINWKYNTWSYIEYCLHSYHVHMLTRGTKKIQNNEHHGWKTRAYSKFFLLNFTKWKPQIYLNWPNSMTILKMRTFTNGLNRYSYILNKNPEETDKKCPCCSHPIEDLDHFLWECPKHEQRRDNWINKLLMYLPYLHELSNKDKTNSLFTLINNKIIYNITVKFILVCLEARKIQDK